MATNSRVEVSLPTDYQSFIHTSRYARWNEILGRRETWSETVYRYLDYITDYVKENHNYEVSPELYDELADYILNLKAMPSMRAMMTAGPALDRTHVAAYNCSFIPIDSPRAFDEAMYILMCGTGVGFSVETANINKLPIVNDEFHDSPTVIKVNDSKEGWAAAFKELIAMLYAGQEPSWDMSLVRPAGSRLKTFGGRASGPEPLEDLFKFAVTLFRNAAGRRLTDLECHDLMCKVGEVVVVGGVRRSAMISLSDLGSDVMRHAKSGQWWLTHPHRALANNSAVYESKPDIGTFMREWTALYESKSGERGIFNREATKVLAPERRDTNFAFGTNPCCFAGETFILTDKGPRRIDSLVGVPFNAMVNGKPLYAPHGSWVSGTGDIYTLTTKEGYSVNLTEDHEIMTPNGWVKARDLERGDKIVLHDHNHAKIDLDSEEFDEGYLLGLFVGDGNFIKPETNAGGEVKVWKQDSGHASMMARAEAAASRVPMRSDWIGWCERDKYYRMNIGRLPQKYGIGYGNKTVTEKVMEQSETFIAGFLRGLFDADGHVESKGNGVTNKGVSVRLGSADYGLMQNVQRMLSRLGIRSSIHTLHPARVAALPNGRGGYSDYECNATWRLVVSGKQAVRYQQLVGFDHANKSAKLSHAITTKTFYNKKCVATFDSLEYLRTDTVYDAEVPGVNAFDANGIYVHNSEITLRPYQFCNLTEVIARADDTEKDIADKVRIATILGTFQSCLTHFKYLRKVWQRNTEEERLLGVSITGIEDSRFLNGALPHRTEKFLDDARMLAQRINAEYADALNIPRSAAITCVKPSGTVSQLTDTASGIHPRYAQYYIRRVRGDKKDPLSTFMQDMGIPCEPDIHNPNNTVVFSFPQKAPEGAILRENRTAIDQLEMWKTYQLHWCEHKPSITVYVREHEWLEVGAWVYENFDTISGISFLPYDNGTYRQAPYEEITEEEYEALKAKMPKYIDWTFLSAYETEDGTSGSQTLACSSGSCEIVDFGVNDPSN